MPMWLLNLKILIKENTNITKLKDIAERFAGKIQKGNVVLFEGELGAGKTTFTRFLINSIFLVLIKLFFLQNFYQDQ